MSLARVLAVSILLLSSCAPDDEAQIQSPVEAPAGSVYYTVRPDLRLCIWPFCGGVWIRAANADLTTCADGSVAAECYVAMLETPMAQNAIGDVTRLVVRGQIVARTQADLPSYFALHADSLWQAQTGMTPKGTYWWASGHSGWYDIIALNRGETRLVHGIDLLATGATPEQIQAAVTALAAGRLIVAGTLDNGGDGLDRSIVLRGSQFYLSIGSRFDGVYDAWKNEVRK